MLVIVCVCVLYLGVATGVVEHEGGLRGLRISTSFVQGLGVVYLVLLHLRVQLGEHLVALSSAGEILDVIVAVTQQRQRCPGLGHSGKQEGVKLAVICRTFEMFITESLAVWKNKNKALQLNIFKKYFISYTQTFS